jgi:hypothetical protein
VLSALEAQDLVDWLDQNDYMYPVGAEAVFEDYILRGWYFLAVRIRPSNPGEVTKQSIAPIQISVETDEPVYPMMISSLSSEPETEILIHFISDHRYTTSNVFSEEVDHRIFYWDDQQDDYKGEYKQWMQEQVKDLNGEVYFVEFAGWLPELDCQTVNGYLDGEPLSCGEDVFVTRFRSYFSPDLFSDDIYFEADVHDNSFSVRVEIRTYGSLSHASLYFTNLFVLSITFVTPKRRFSHSTMALTRLFLVMVLCLLLF